MAMPLASIRSSTLTYSQPAGRLALDAGALRKCARQEISNAAVTSSLPFRRWFTQTSHESSLLTQRPTLLCRRKHTNLPRTASHSLPQHRAVSKSQFSTSSQRPFLSWLRGNRGSSRAGGKPKIYTTPYRPKRQWPPDMTNLSEKQQFRLERKYRRRAKLKYVRPRWDKWTKVVQWGLIGFVVVYSVLFMEMKGGGPNPFEGIRKRIWGQLDNVSVWSTPEQRLRKDIDRPADHATIDKS